MRSPSQPLRFVVAVALLLVVAAFTPSGQAAERQGYRTAYACEGTTLDIECETGTVINVIRANYGRFSITICNVHGNTEWSVNCQSPRSHRVLSERCNGRSECKFEVSSESFGDPCPGTFKYIEIHYMCGIATTTTTSPRTPPLWFITTKPPLWLPAFNTTSSTTTTTSTSTTTSTTTTTQKPTSVSTSTTTPKPPATTTTSTLSPSTSATEDPKDPKKTKVEEETSETEDETAKGKDKDVEDHVTTVDQEEITTLPSVASASSTVSPQVPKQTSSPTSAPPLTHSPPVSPPDIGTDSNSYDTPWCPPSFGRGLYWNWTMGGDISVQPCPGGASGWARRQCLLSGWKGPADLSECRSIWLSALEERALAHGSVLGVAADLATVTASKPLYGGDLTTTARLVSTLSRQMVQVLHGYPDSRQRKAFVTELVQSALTTGSALLAEGMDGPWGDLSYAERRNAATQLMVGLEEAGFLLADELPSDTISSLDKTHVLLSARAVSSQGDSVRFPSSEDNEEWGHVDFVALPPEAIVENSQRGVTRIVFLTYRHMETILVPQDEPLGHRYSSSSRRNISRFVNTRVVSASLGHGRHIQLPEPVTLIFRLLRQDNVTNPVCAFWDYTSATWSDEGCRVTHHNQSHVTCKCDHLTNFAVIMEEMTGSPESDTMAALRVVAYVGCVVSAVCVAGAALTFLLLRGLASPRTVIRKHLCICLFATEVVFLLGVWRTEVPILCAVIAGVLHYTLLSAFTWMFMEGVYVYVTLVRVVECDSLRLRWWHYALAYGFPLLVVAIAAIADPFSFGTPAYCWLRTDNYFVFSFVGPVLLLLAAEVLLLAAALVYICRINPDDAVKTKEMARLADARTWLRGSLALLLLMVLTWTLGLLFLHQPSLPIAASFCVLNALVGIFIFVYYCFRNQKYLPALCQLNGVKGSTGNCPPPGGHLLSGGTSTGTGGSLRHTGVSGPLPLGALHQSLPRHHTVTLPRHTSITTARSTTTTTPGHTTFNSLGHDEDASYKSFSRDSGHGGSEQEDSPRTQWNNHGQPRYSNSLTADLKNAYLAKLNSMNAAGVTDLLNSQFPHIQPNGNVISVPNSYTTTLTPTTQQMTASTRRSGGPRAHSPWNHTYMEIETEADPVYEEIERERWAGRGTGMNGPNNNGNAGSGGTGASEVMQVSDMSDEDGKRGTPSDMSRQSSRSYGDSRPLLPYHSSASQGPHPRYSQEHQFALSEERLRDFNMAQMSRDLEQLQQVQQQWSRESLMTVAVLNGEQVVCRLTSPSNPQAPQSLPVIHEGGRSVLASPMGAPQMAQQPMTNGYPAQVVVSHAPIHHRPPQYSEC